MVCLDAGLSAMKMAHTSSFETHKGKRKKENTTAEELQRLQADSSYCTVTVYLNVYVYNCKCIIININIVLEPVFFQ